MFPVADRQLLYSGCLGLADCGTATFGQSREQSRRPIRNSSVALTFNQGSAVVLNASGTVVHSEVVSCTSPETDR